MNKWLKSGLFLLLTANMLIFAEDKNKEAPQLERPAFDNKVQFLVPGTRQVIPNNEVIRRIGKQAFESTDTDLSIIPLDRRTNVNNTNSSVDRDDLWPISHVSEGDAYYYLGSGAAGDTFSVVLTPAAPAVVTEVYYQFFSAGNCVAFGSDYGTASALSPNGDAAGIAGGSTDLSPIGQLRTTPTPNSIAGYVADWSADALLDIGGTFIVGDSTDLSNVPPFVISYVKGGETPHPLAAATAALGVTTSFTWFGGPWNTGDPGLWGRYSAAIENMLMVKVTYPWGAPMAIQSISKPPNTYAASKTVTINVGLLDDVGDDGMAIDENDTLTYHYVDPAGTEHTGSLTATSAVGADGNGIYSFDITYSGAVAGDEISYWVTLKDDDDLESASEPQSFAIKAPNNPGADLLIILDSFSDRQSNMFELFADGGGVVYEVWDVTAEGGIDASVISQGWNNIIVYGWGGSTVPMFAADVDPGYASFIDGGGNLLLTDMDWMCSSSAGCGSVDFAWTAGDFAYDYFGLASGLNDPAPFDTVDVYGLAVSSMDSPFETDPLVLRHNLYLGEPGIGWIDYVTAGAGADIFTDADGAGVGVMMDHSLSGGGKAVYLSFMADAAGDTAADGSWDYTQFSTFAAGVFTEFGITSPPLIGAVTGQTLSTASASAFPVTAAIADADGDAITATLYYRGSGDTSWTSASMTETAGTFSADIPAVDSASVISYYIGASDGTAATTYPDNNTPAVSFFHHQPTTGVDVLYVDDSGYSAYFGNPGASIAGTYDSYASWYYGATDGTIWAAYDHIVWNADYTGGTIWSWTTATHELAAFMSGGGNLLLLGDEPLYAGGIAGSPIVAGFSAGMAASDWFGLSSAWADGYNYRPTYFTTVTGDALTTGLADTVDYANPLSSSYDWTDQLCVGDFDYYANAVTVADTASTTTASADTVETWDPDEGVWQAITTTTTTVTTVTSVTNDTLSIEQSAWYATRNNNGTSKAIWLPFYFAGIADEQVIVGTDTSYIDYQDTLMANVMSYFNDAAAPTGAAGFFGPELGDMFFASSDTSVVLDTVVTVVTDSTNLGVDVAGIPQEFALKGNFPNPFNPKTSIMFSLDITSPIVVKIYSILGQEISTLHSGILESGYHSMLWNGTDQFGKSVGSGIYIYRI
ncbi:hypothetical protein CMO93_01985, partial [Candidatus Woesearchaeota archaeon]|nr:hypothetical protein [Candidatus Woesearchaeota archaeon]